MPEAHVSINPVPAAAAVAAGTCALQWLSGSTLVSIIIILAGAALYMSFTFFINFASLAGTYIPPLYPVILLVALSYAVQRIHKKKRVYLYDRV